MCVCVCVCICIYICTYMYVYFIHMHTYTYTYNYTYIYIIQTYNTRACVCVCLCMRTRVCVPACVRACAYVVSQPPPKHTEVPGFALHENKCLCEQVLATWRASPAASAKRLAGTAACKSANDCRASCPFLPPPVSASLLAGDLKMLFSVSTNCRWADAATQLQLLQQSCNRAATAAEVQIIERVHQLPVCRCSNQ